jgi:hypothetical protein
MRTSLWLCIVLALAMIAVGLAMGETRRGRRNFVQAQYEPVPYADKQKDPKPKAVDDVKLGKHAAQKNKEKANEAAEKKESKRGGEERLAIDPRYVFQLEGNVLIKSRLVVKDLYDLKK